MDEFDMEKIKEKFLPSGEISKVYRKGGLLHNDVY